MMEVRKSKPAWNALTDAEKYQVWRSMTVRQRAVAWDQVSVRDQRMLQRADALAAVRSRGDVPEECGPAMINAPARGQLLPFMPMATMVDAKGEERRVEVGYRGRHAARVGDVWDRMEEQACRSGGGALFDVGQLQAGRDYGALVERCNSSGLAGTSLEVLSGKSGAGSVSEAVAHDMARLRLLRARIGDGLALQVRRVRPSHRGKRVALRHLDLVDRVCVGGQTISEVLKRCGWVENGEERAALRTELCGCLDRMGGATPTYGHGHKMQKRD